jgi:hypothetical protein
MLECITGPVGFAMHEERLATAAKNLRLAEAQLAGRGQQARGRRSDLAASAGMLTGLAARLASAITKVPVAATR